jgi:hypothetical protein
MLKKYIPIILLLTFAIILSVSISFKKENKQNNEQKPEIAELNSPPGVCPPFYLLTETGDTINPVSGLNADKPYSPKQTCGKCHDYEKITQAYHFQQGKDESPDSLLTSRAAWVSHPGNYGGNWCSPAPLYAYLSPEENEHEALLDMTSYTFVNKCGVCHPGGGPLEYDRNGKRYDQVVRESDFEDGEKNALNGDYYKANWNASGIIEADCFMCHLPQYDNNAREKQIKSYNYKYAALEGSGLGTVKGSVAEGDSISVSYHAEMFNPDGTLEPNIISEPRNSACLACHAKPGYKKRGADFRARLDVHLDAGLKCVDCHPAGSKASDERISEKEMHEIAKGDDPGGVVRNSLNNTMRSCTDCHDTGYLGAPVAKHEWLPDLHFEKMACQTCHVSQRYVKSTHYVASDVFNPGTKIPTKGKHLWTFYGPDMKYWNHYGDLEMMGYDDKPEFEFKPELIKYKGLIYPANRVHTSWPGLQINGQEALMQPKMGDVYKMWTAHQKDPSQYRELSKITDDNKDEVIEINRPEEIDALIAALSQKLSDINYPMKNKQVVWVMNNRLYTSGKEYRELPMRSWEASPYGNVHTYNHDILPAKAALGANSCTECHALNSDFFYAEVLKNPVGSDGLPEYVRQYEVLEMNSGMVWLSAFREQYIKSFMFPSVLFLICIMAVFAFVRINKSRNFLPVRQNILAAFYAFFLLLFFFVYLKPELNAYIFPENLWFDKNHFINSAFVLLSGLYTLFKMRQSGKNSANLFLLQLSFMVLASLGGLFILLKFEIFATLTALSYTIFDFAVAGVALISVIYFIRKSFEYLNENFVFGKSTSV